MSFHLPPGPTRSMPLVEQATLASGDLEQTLERHRRELTGYCYRMLGSPFEAEDAVQETMLRAWRSFDNFEGRSAVRSWLYRIATNVCFDMLGSRGRRATPMDMGPAQEPVAENLFTLPEATWIEPTPDRRDRRGRRPGRAGNAAGDDQAGVRRRAPAPAGAPARGADPVRGPALEGRRGRGAARVRAWRASTARCSERGRRSRPAAPARPTQRPPRTRASGSCSSATSRRSRTTTWRR